jgi:hypothetical protein
VECKLNYTDWKWDWYFHFNWITLQENLHFKPVSIKLRNEKKLDLDLIQIQFWDIFNGKIKKNTDYICDCNWGRNIICGLMLKVDIDKITTEKLRSQISDRETIFHVLLIWNKAWKQNLNTWYGFMYCNLVNMRRVGFVELEAHKYVHVCTCTMAINDYPSYKSRESMPWLGRV